MKWLAYGPRRNERYGVGQRGRRVELLVAFVGVPLLTGCGLSSGSSGNGEGPKQQSNQHNDAGAETDAAGAEDCVEGTSGCQCYGNGTCDSGLVCIDDLCRAEAECQGSDGERGCACYGNGTCNSELVCHEDVCRAESDLNIGDCAGIEGCSCYGNGTCNDDLVCAEGYCYVLPERPDDCSTGTKSCDCYGNGTCNGDLVCVEDLCLSLLVPPTPSPVVSPTPAPSASASESPAPTVVPSATTSPAGSGGQGGADNTGGSGGVAGSVPTATSLPEGGSGGEAGGGAGGASGGSGGSDDPTGGSGGQTGDTGQSGNGGEGGEPPVMTTPPVDTGNNLITNGDFSNGATDWTLTDDLGSLASNGGISGGAFCVQGTSGYIYHLGWPDSSSKAFSLSAATTYQISYDAWRDSGTVRFAMKVGQAISPYTAAYEVTSVSVGTTSTRFVHTFTTSSSFSTMGLVFSMTFSSSAIVCVDNVRIEAID